MDLKYLKESIINKNIKDTFLIFKIEDNDFIPIQYIKEISSIINKPIEYIDSLDFIYSKNINLFESKTNSLRVYKCDSFDIVDRYLNSVENLIIISPNISKEVRSEYSYNIVEIPKLEQWQIEDYALSLGEGLNKDFIDIIIKGTDYNIYRIDSELAKLKEFAPSQRDIISRRMLQEGSIDYLSQFNIFDLTNAIQCRDINKIGHILGSINPSFLDPLALISILYQNFRKMILVWEDKNPTPESTGLKSNQIWVIKNMPHNYSKEQLIKIFSFLTSLDFRLKSGNLPSKNLLDYTIINILTI